MSHEEEAEDERQELLSSYGYIGNELLVCHFVENHVTKGIYLGDNLLHHSTSILIIQIILIFIVGKITHLLFKPCHQTQLISQVVAGIILGPVLLGRHHPSFELLFPKASRMTLATFAEFGMIIYFFKMGVQINPKQILMIEKEAVAIGLVGHISSIVFGSVVLNFINRVFYPIKSEVSGIVGLLILESMTAFSGISRILKEMNILNSEIGRMALSTSMVNDASSWVLLFVIVNGAKALRYQSYLPILAVAASTCSFIIIFFILKPLVIWISNRNPRGKPMTETHFVAIMFILLVLGFYAEISGQPAFLVAFWFGLLLPDGPPLGSVLAERLDAVGSTLIVPAYCTLTGLRTIVPPLTLKALSIVAVLLAVQAGKFSGTFFSSLYFQVELRDSVTLSLIMCCKGLIDLACYTLISYNKVIGPLSFTLAVYTMVFVTWLATTLVYYIYDPSKRFRNYIRKSIKDSQKDLEFRLLVCVHHEENVYPLINLLQASNPPEDSRLSVFVLHLMELSGRAAPILRKNDNNANKSSNPHSGEISSQHITNAFDQFQQHNNGSVMVQSFTVISPYSSMHDDICCVAMDTKSHFVILPYHKRWSASGNVEMSSASIRTLNHKVFSKAPCSVGILIDRSEMSGTLLVVYDKSHCEIAMIFLGGEDDQEALAFSLHLAQHPNIKLTVLWIRVKMQQKQRNVKNPYIDLMEYIKYNPKLKGKVSFKEEIVEDGIGTTHVIREMEGYFNMVIVGRHHIENSGCTLGLMEWCELPELGPIGNLLASDFTSSVLVVQHQPFRCIR